MYSGDGGSGTGGGGVGCSAERTVGTRKYSVARYYKPPFSLSQHTHSYKAFLPCVQGLSSSHECLGSSGSCA